jgi:hypothetical protein
VGWSGLNASGSGQEPTEVSGGHGKETMGATTGSGIS